MNLRWPGFRKVRGTVCKRIRRRMRSLDLTDFAAYRTYVEEHPDEWPVLDAFCRITISRFYRDRRVFDVLRRVVLPELAERASSRPDAEVRCWSAGCASGEEVYSLELCWLDQAANRWPGVSISIVGSDVDPRVLERARVGCYDAATLRELPDGWLERGFARVDDRWCVRREVREGIRFVQHDIRGEPEAGPFDLVLCRNLVFTYFDGPAQSEALRRLDDCLHPRGFLVIGTHETLPDAGRGFARLSPGRPIYRKAI